MPRKKLIHAKDIPYHVTARGNNREPFPGALHECWRVFCKGLSEIALENQVKTHAFVLMPNHFHLLISTPADDLGKSMQRFIASVTKTINWKNERSGRIFGARYHWSLINRIDYFDCVTKYIYRNPVKAGLTERAEDYPYSSLKLILDRHPFPFPLHPHCQLNQIIPEQKLKEYLDWLNEPFKNESEIVVKNALKKPTFAVSKAGWKRTQVSLEGSSIYAAAGIKKVSDTKLNKSH